ncbi:ATP-binding protein [Streptomyces sp.]|uniref:ATP-binding protein n=1 Tax=Streptomyces sp. TaxID=1931 RepID=UPI002F3E713F
MTAPPTPIRPQPSVPAGEFAQRFSATRLGARLARHLTLHQLNQWGIPYDGDTAQAAAVIVGELAANAATHGRVPGRDFELRLALADGTLRIEVSDTRSERRPPGPGEVKSPDPLAESGRGLFLVEALAHRWAVLDRLSVGKTVRAELDLPGRDGPRP